MSYPKREPEIRFWEKVDKNGPIPKHQPDLGQCWIWAGSKREHGHGRFDVPGVGSSAHRFSYHIHNGPIPEGRGVLHKCDNGSCVNPSHLFTGTQKDNMEDAANKNRVEYGEKHYRSVLTDGDIRKIRQLYSEGIRIKEIAEMFPVNRGCISKIVHRLRWSHIV